MIAIVTDSSAGYSTAELAKIGVHAVPLSYICDGKIYEEKNRGENGDFKKMISALAAVGYDGPVSIEHEDSLMTPQEGLTKAILYLKEILIHESNSTKAWWI